MRLVHISDWHLGKRTRGVDRRADHQAVVDEIIGICREQRPDVIVHTGDLFETSGPAVEDMTFAHEALRELGSIAPVVVLAGNHDSPALFGLFAMLLGPSAPVRFVPKMRRPADGGILTYDGRDGERIRIAPLPFVLANRMIDPMLDPDRWSASYAEKIHDLENILARGLADGFDPSKDISIFAAHLHVGNAVLSKSERGGFVTPAYATAVDHLPPVSYAAFGHIHIPQDLPGASVTGTYAGSPIQLDFGEARDSKSLVIVDAQPGRPAEVTRVPLNAGRKLLEFSGTLDDLRSQSAGFGDALMKVTVRTEEVIPGLVDQVTDILGKATMLVWIDDCAARKGAQVAAAPVEGVEEPSFPELFAEYISQVGVKSGTRDDVINVFGEVFAAVDDRSAARLEIEDRLIDILSDPVGAGFAGEGCS